MLEKSNGGGSQLAKENNVPLLSQIPIETDTFSGTGKDLPVVHTSRDSITASSKRGVGSACLGLVLDYSI